MLKKMTNTYIKWQRKYKKIYQCNIIQGTSRKITLAYASIVNNEASIQNMAWKIGSEHIWEIGTSANFPIVVPLELKKAQAQYNKEASLMSQFVCIYTNDIFLYKNI